MKEHNCDLSQAMYEAYEIFSEGSAREDTIGLLMEELIFFYDAPKTEIYYLSPKGERTLVYEYFIEEEISESDCEGQEIWNTILGGMNTLRMDLFYPKENCDSRKYLDYISSLIHGVIRNIEENEIHNRMTEQTRVVAALSKVYYAVYVVDLNEMTAKSVHSPGFVTNAFGKSEHLLTLLDILTERFVSDDYKEIMDDFNRVENWRKLLRERSSISMEFLGNNIGWSRANIIVSKKEPNNEVTEVLYAVQEINDQISREHSHSKETP